MRSLIRIIKISRKEDDFSVYSSRNLLLIGYILSLSVAYFTKYFPQALSHLMSHNDPLNAGSAIADTIGTTLCQSLSL